MSSAVLVRIERISAAVKDGFADFTSAAIAAACGAAAEVPKNGLGNPPTPVTLTPSAAVMSGFCSTWPPVEDTFPGVIGVPSAPKKMRRGPSELNVSTRLPVLNGCGNTAPACVAATPYEPSPVAVA